MIEPTLYPTHWSKVVELIVEDLERCSGESLAEIANDLGVFLPYGEIRYVGDSMFEVEKMCETENRECWEDKLMED